MTIKRVLPVAALATALASLSFPAAGAPSVGLVDFNTTDGDLTVVSTNNPPGAWTYDGSRGTWSCYDQTTCATAPRSSRLNTPAWTVVSAGAVTLTFAHRYSFEADTTRWDGGQVRLSVNGGAYVMVPAANFTANPYNNTIGGAAVPTSELVGQLAFTAESPGYIDGTFITSVALLGTFNAGDTISVQFIAAWDDCAQGQVPNWEIDSLEFTPSLEDRRPPPSFTDAALPADATVVEGTSHTLQVAVVGQTSLQWFKDSFAIPGAIATSYTITNMSDTDVGQYHAEAYNALGTAVSRVATVSIIADHTAPVLMFAFSDPSDLTRYTLWVNEPLCTDEGQCGSDADDNFNYLVESLDGTEFIEIGSVTVTDGTNLALTATSPRTPGRAYKLYVDRGLGIGDRYGNIIPTGPLSQINILEPIAFQQTVNGYSDTHDTELRGAAPTTVQGNGLFVTVDTSDGGAMSQGLLRFGNIVGTEPGRIPPGATIISARLTLTHGNGATPDGDLVNAHRMLITWDEATATYSSLVNGVSANGVEARTASDFTINSAGITAGAKLTFDVATSVQAWANGEANHGWAFIPTGGNGYRWDTSESTVPNSQPRLEVLYSVPPCSAVMITEQPAPSTTVNEGGSFTLAVTVESQGCPPTFQWTLDGSDIQGATESTYAVPSAIPGVHNGVYRVRVSNDLPSTMTSANAVVDVIADTVKPTVTSAVSEPDLVTITLVYSEAVSASADSASRYSLVPAVGGPALSLTVARVNATTVRLTTAARALGATYNLSVSGVSDLASTPNTMDPVVIPITASSRRILAADAVWKYDQTGNYDSTLEPGGTAWHAPGFDDSVWLSGPGLFGLESAGVISVIPLPNPLIRTPWTVSAAQLTYYLRTTITVPAAPANAILVMRHATDDGLVAYVDGVEKTRYNMTGAQPILHDVLAPTASPEGVVVCAPLADVPPGNHTLAVEVHQSTTGSSDVVFGAELLQVIPPSITVQRQPDGSVTLSWPNDPGWALVQSTSVTGPFAAVAGNPPGVYTVAAPVGNAFYQLQCR